MSDLMDLFLNLKKKKILLQDFTTSTPNPSEMLDGRDGPMDGTMTFPGPGGRRRGGLVHKLPPTGENYRKLETKAKMKIE